MVLVPKRPLSITASADWICGPVTGRPPGGFVGGPQRRRTPVFDGSARGPRIEAVPGGHYRGPAAARQVRGPPSGYGWCVQLWWWRRISDERPPGGRPLP